MKQTGFTGPRYIQVEGMKMPGNVQRAGSLADQATPGLTEMYDTVECTGLFLTPSLDHLHHR